MPALVSALADSLPGLTRQRLIGLRWLSVLAMVAAALFSPYILATHGLLPPLLAVAAVMASLNACLHLADALDRREEGGFPLLSPGLQLALDLTGWGAFIYLSGGATNPLISIFLPLVAIAAQVMAALPAWLFGMAAILAYSFLWRFYQPLPLADAVVATRLHLLGMWLVFAVSALVVVWFVSRMTQAIRQRDVALAEARETAWRNDWVVALGSLAAGAAHEMSTPLATLTLLIEGLLEEGEDHPRWREDLAAMQAQIAACKNSLTQLTARAGHGRSEALAAQPAREWLRHVLAAWHAQYPRHNLEIHLAPELEEQRLAPDIGLERALHNLLDNAGRASRSWIAVRAECQATDLFLTVSDDGPGIPAPALARFRQGQPIPSVAGLGIGLLLAKGAVERLGGSLSLDLAPHGGTRACLRLPLSPLCSP